MIALELMKSIGWSVFWLAVLGIVAALRYRWIIFFLVAGAFAYGSFVWWIFSHARP